MNIPKEIAIKILKNELHPAKALVQQIEDIISINKIGKMFVIEYTYSAYGQSGKKDLFMTTIYPCKVTENNKQQGI